MTIVVVGDALLDRDLTGAVERVCPDAPAPVVAVDEDRPRPGGAALAARLLADDGHDVTLVTAVGDDAPGRLLLRSLQDAGVEVVDCGLDGPTPTKTRVRSAGQTLVRIDTERSTTSPGALDRRGRAAISAAAAVLVSDYGRGLPGRADVRSAVSAAPCPVVWDPHPRGGAPLARATLVTPSEAEARAMADPVEGDGIPQVARRADDLAARWRVGAVCITLGGRGALVGGGAGPPLVVPADRVAHGDACGAGDRFAGAAALALGRGAVVSEAVTAAVATASAFVAAGGASALAAPAPTDTGPPPSRPTRPGDARSLVDSVRAAGGTVVATGGCFDILHAGHLSMLRAARRLGDCLVVCLNSDASVARLKGPDRPRQPAADRATLLSALDCVDAVEVFDEDTPAAVLTRLRPHIFVKGGDYSAPLPEADVLAPWGGQAVVVPYLDGRSTTLLLQEASHAR